MTILEEETKVTAASGAGPATAQLSPSSTLSSTLTASASTAASVVAHSGSPPQTSPEVVTSIAASVAAVAASSGKNQYLSTMISNVADRYITPEYLAPLPPTVRLLIWLDFKT